MADEARLPLLQVDPNDIASRVLVVGDPERAKRAATLLSDARSVGANREYHTYTGELSDTRLSVCSHGVGSAGAAVCFEELARAGAQTIVRAGTCGALTDDVSDGDMIIANAAVRDEGLTPRLVPAGFPAAADPELSLRLRRAAEAAAETVRAGLVLTTDLFYPSAALGVDWSQWQKSGVLAVEMELSALYVIATLHGLQAGALLVVDGNPTRAAQDMSEYDPYRPVVREATGRMLELALGVLAE